MEQQKDNTQENDNTRNIYNIVMKGRINTLKEREGDNNIYNSLFNSENGQNGSFLGILSNHKKTLNTNDLIRDSIKESENETIKEEIEQANENISNLLLHKPRSKKVQSEMNKLIEGLK